MAEGGWNPSNVKQRGPPCPACHHPCGCVRSLHTDGPQSPNQPSTISVEFVQKRLNDVENKILEFNELMKQANSNSPRQSFGIPAGHTTGKWCASSPESNTCHCWHDQNARHSGPHACFSCSSRLSQGTEQQQMMSPPLDMFHRPVKTENASHSLYCPAALPTWSCSMNRDWSGAIGSDTGSRPICAFHDIQHNVQDPRWPSYGVEETCAQQNICEINSEVAHGADGSNADNAKMTFADNAKMTLADNAKMTPADNAKMTFADNAKMTLATTEFQTPDQESTESKNTEDTSSLLLAMMQNNHENDEKQTWSLKDVAGLLAIIDEQKKEIDNIKEEKDGAFMLVDLRQRQCNSYQKETDRLRQRLRILRTEQFRDENE